MNKKVAELLVSLHTSFSSLKTNQLSLHHEGGGFLAKFWVGVCRPNFQKGAIGLTSFCEMIPLVRLISTSKVA